MPSSDFHLDPPLPFGSSSEPGTGVPPDTALNEYLIIYLPYEGNNAHMAVKVEAVNADSAIAQVLDGSARIPIAILMPDNYILREIQKKTTYHYTLNVYQGGRNV